MQLKVLVWTSNFTTKKTRTLKVIFTFDLQNRQLLTESDLSDFTLFVKTTIEKKK